MSNKPAFNSKVLLGALFAILATVSGLASCGGASVSQNQATGVSPPSTTAVSTVVSASATPAIITSGSSAIVTWSSANSTSCSASNGGVGTGTTGSFSTGALTTNTNYTITCVGPAGTTSQSTMVAVANTPTLTAILNASNAWANTPVRTGPVYYYCDCGTGADSHCVAGNDANAGTNSSAPRQTIANAIARLNSLTGPNNTVALCKGGAFNANPSGASPFYGFGITNASCPAGSTCNDLREYPSPAFLSSAKPVINAPVNTTGINLLTFNGGGTPIGGIRILNIKLQGDIKSIMGSTGLFIYNGGHDITLGNLTVDLFTIGLYDEPGDTTTLASNNVIMTGNTITNSEGLGYLGGGNIEQVSYNYWDGNGSSNSRDHTIYISSHQPVSNMKFEGNYIHGQYGPLCNGVVMTAHGQFNNLSLSNNDLVIDPSASGGGCYGINIGSGLYPIPVFFRNTVISGNTIRNGGNDAIGIATCANCLISDNVMIFDVGNTSVVNAQPTGIVSAYVAARTSPADDLNTGTTIVNNTIWAASNTISGLLGVQIRIEGSGYIVANNTVNYTSTNAGNWGGVSCFDYSSLPLATSYTFINNNHCYSAAASYLWEATSGTSLTAWKTSSSAYGYDSSSIQGLPNFKSTTSPYNFQPNTGSPLLGAGSTIYAPTTATDITGVVNWLNLSAIGAYE